MKKILLVGDSLTQFSFDVDQHGFGAKLQNKFVRKFDVLNRGYSGYNTKWIADIIDKILAEFENLDMITLCLGANDACLPGNSQHVPLDIYKSKLREIAIKLLKKTTRLIIITPPFVDDNRGPERQNAVTINYRQSAIQVAQELNASSLDSWQLLANRPINHPTDITEHDLLNLVDGLHFNVKGNECIYRGISNLVDSKWPELDQTEPTEPWWQALVI